MNLAGRPAFAHPCEGVHKSMSLMISSLLFQLYVCWIVVGGRIAAVLCGVVLFNIARSIFFIIVVKLFLHTFS